jgi:nitrogen regulatory protein PII
MQKMVMIVYNEVMDTEVMTVLAGCGVESYTKIAGVFGRGKSAGTHLGNDIWPGKNNILYVGCDERKAQAVFACVKDLRARLGHEGIKAFIMPIEAIT